ncbi:DUF2726 domain-containing protein [Chloroflexus sp.]|uniref:DUF2726 domain-containing protein n=1 Tax=Chloroflexus sp. TaxID=1904827 RepID=UPI002ACEF437|nr:DUF2726 domain-containing protein [Chloroflexus sp.]
MIDDDSLSLTIVVTIAAAAMELVPVLVALLFITIGVILLGAVTALVITSAASKRRPSPPAIPPAQPSSPAPAPWPERANDRAEPAAATLDDEAWPFYAKRLLTQPEQTLYHRLVQALPECLIFSQVQLSRILGVKQGYDFWYWHNRINHMSADFVVCRKDSSVVAVIELDDRTHLDPVRQVADVKKDKALAAAGLRIIRWPTHAMPDVATIRATVLAGEHRLVISAENERVVRL